MSIASFNSIYKLRYAVDRVKAAGYNIALMSF